MPGDWRRFGGGSMSVGTSISELIGDRLSAMPAGERRAAHALIANYPLIGLRTLGTKEPIDQPMGEITVEPVPIGDCQQVGRGQPRGILQNPLIGRIQKCSEAGIGFSWARRELDVRG